MFSRVFKWPGLPRCLLTFKYFYNQITCCVKLLKRGNMRRTKKGGEITGADFNRYNLRVPWFDINSAVYAKGLNEIFVYSQ